MRIILYLLITMLSIFLLGFTCFLLIEAAVYKDMDKKARTRYRLQIVLLLLVLAGGYWGRKLFIDYKHPYKDMDVIGAWDYGYSVTFDVGKKPLRTDKELFSLDLYTETEIVLNDDGSFRILIEDTEITGAWTPDENNSNIVRLSPIESKMNGAITDNEIRWDKGEDMLCIGLSKDTVPENLSHLFTDDETSRYIFCKTFRDNVRVVYSEDDNDYYEDEWDDGNNGLPFNYHP